MKLQNFVVPLRPFPFHLSIYLHPSLLFTFFSQPIKIYRENFSLENFFFILLCQSITHMTKTIL